MKIKAILIPGNGEGDVNNPDFWFSFVKKSLAKLGVEVMMENFPDPVEAKAEFWLPFIKGLGADENTILIGYSSGAIAAMRYAEENKILGTVLIAAYHTDLGMESERVSGYFRKSWDFERIRSNQKFIIQFHSADDPFISSGEAYFVRDKLKTEFHQLKNKGHFGYPFELNEFPELVAALKKEL